MGSNELSVAYQRTSNTFEALIQQTEKDWDLVFHIPLGEWESLEVNGTSLPLEKTIEARGNEILIRLRK